MIMTAQEENPLKDDPGQEENGNNDATSFEEDERTSDFIYGIDENPPFPQLIVLSLQVSLWPGANLLTVTVLRGNQYDETDILKVTVILSNKFRYFDLHHLSYFLFSFLFQILTVIPLRIHWLYCDTSDSQ